MDDDGQPGNIFQIPTLAAPTAVEFETNYEAVYLEEQTPIVIDNGATDFRYGFATSSSPYASTNAMAKFKDRRTQKQLLLFGSAVDADSTSKLATKTAWEGDLLSSSDALESALDFAFLRMGISTPSVNHPVIISERLATPLSARSITSELLFECYSVPYVTYAIDSLLSHHQNRLDTPLLSRDGLVLSFNTASTSIIPVLGGRGILSHAKRLPWGGSQASDYLLKLLQLKYPTFPTKITPVQSTWMLHNFCTFSPDYSETLKRLSDPLAMSASDVIIQFPYVLSPVNDKTQEELDRAAEKRKEAGRRLQEQAAKARSEKLFQHEHELESLLELRMWKVKEKKADFASRLRAEGIDSEAMLEEDIKRLEQSVKRARKKEEGAGADDEPAEEPSYPLVDVPDHELDESQLKEKRRQRLMKAGSDARARARLEKQKEKEVRAEVERQEGEEREKDFKGWSHKVRSEHLATMERIKERKKKRAALGDRKSAASQNRMKNIASLAADDSTGVSGRKRKKAGDDDMFGQNDADWAIYREVNLDHASSDEEDDLQTLSLLESKLLTHDPGFSITDTYASLQSRQSALMNAFRPRYDEGDVIGSHRLHLNTERYRVPEAWFSPGAAGVDVAGLGELVEQVLKSFGQEEQRRLVGDVFLTGGPSLIPALSTRIYNTLRPILPPSSTITVSSAEDPRLDAWKGMASVAQSPEFSKYGVSRAEYDEWGGERIKKWWGSNWNAAF